MLGCTGAKTVLASVPSAHPGSAASLFAVCVCFAVILACARHNRKSKQLDETTPLLPGSCPAPARTWPYTRFIGIALMLGIVACMVWSADYLPSTVLSASCEPGMACMDPDFHEVRCCGYMGSICVPGKGCRDPAGASLLSCRSDADCWGSYPQCRAGLSSYNTQLTCHPR
jgi:hypothetical protein